jgi:putative transposase
MPQFLNGLAVEDTAAVFGYEDQMDMHCKIAVSTVPKVIALLHRPDYNGPMERRQAFQFELKPNGEQQRQMSRSAGCARYIYNKALALKKERYEKKEPLTRFQLDKMLVQWKQETPWLSEAPAHALQQAILDLDRAYTNFFKKRAKFPKFHKKGLRDAFRESDRQCIKLDQVNSRIQLPKIGWVRYRNSREVLGEIRNVTVSLSVGKWFVSISTRREVEPPWHPSTSSVGLDWGVARFYTLSDGEYQEQLQPLREFLPKLAKLQRRLARKKKLSRNWKKTKAKITKLHTKIANIRKDLVHKSSNNISKNHAVVFVEDLQVKNMCASAKGTKAKPGNKVGQKSRLNRSILDASPFELRRQLEYKTQWSGGLLVSVPPQNTSRKCPECRHTSAENRKTQTKFVCVECGFSADADWVGAVNIKEAGLASLACSQPSPDARASCQEPTEGIVCASV